MSQNLKTLITKLNDLTRRAAERAASLEQVRSFVARETIAQACREWDWSRSQLADGSTAVSYDVQDGPAHASEDARLLALRFGRDGRVTPFDAPPRQPLPGTAWRIDRRMRGPSPARVTHQLEDTPFYQRCVLESELMGEPVTSFHETLNVPRLVSPVVQAMLPWRMPRRS